MVAAKVRLHPSCPRLTTWASDSIDRGTEEVERLKNGYVNAG